MYRNRKEISDFLGLEEGGYLGEKEKSEWLLMVIEFLFGVMKTIEIAAQLCKHTNNQQIVYFQWMHCIICEFGLNIFKYWIHI